MARRKQEWEKDDTTDDDRDVAPTADVQQRLAERLIRMVTASAETWRTCREASCRRRRACSTSGIPCWDPEAVAPELHSNDPRVRGAARLMYYYRGQSST